jgi:putative SOS response-associated peptidase YedK
MCGRFTQKFTWQELHALYGVTNPPQNIEPRYNLAPTQKAWVVRVNPETKTRSLDALRWGLVPHWAKDLAFGSRCINARAETAATAPAFRDAFKSRRCLVPASGFFEWKKIGKTKQPYAIVPTDAPVFSFAGLWSSWRDRAAGEGAPWIETCAILTGEPNEVAAAIHNRMPVILPREAWAAWLGEEPATAVELAALLKPFPADRMRAYMIGSRVNSVKNDDAGLLEPMIAEGGVAV